MSKKEKLVNRLLLIPADFTWDELATFLAIYGYRELTSRKKKGSGRKFVDDEKNVINLHKLHPTNIVKKVYLRGIVNNLKEKGKIKDD